MYLSLTFSPSFILSCCSAESLCDIQLDALICFIHAVSVALEKYDCIHHVYVYYSSALCVRARGD